MKIDIIRFAHGDDDTLGILLINGKFRCFTLEDEKRTFKVFGETRIPEGKYKLVFRKEGGFHNRYINRFGGLFHRGMLQIQDVPNFKYVLIHIGNDDDDTAGCILVGDQLTSNFHGNGFVGYSTSAYRQIYPEIARAIESGEEVNIEIKSI